MSEGGDPGKAPGCCLPTSRSWWRPATWRRRSWVARSSTRSPRPRRSREPSPRWRRRRAAWWSSPQDARRSHLPLLAPGRRALAELAAPYESSRARELIGRACRSLGDEDSARLELEAARDTFARLGAATDVTRVEGPSGLDHPSTPTSSPSASSRSCACSPRGDEQGDRRRPGRQREDGRPAREQHLRQARVSSRAAATGYAHEHGLVRSATG